jgi:hypothetical protein
MHLPQQNTAQAPAKQEAAAAGRQKNGLRSSENSDVSSVSGSRPAVVFRAHRPIQGVVGGGGRSGAGFACGARGTELGTGSGLCEPEAASLVGNGGITGSFTPDPVAGRDGKGDATGVSAGADGVRGTGGAGVAFFSGVAVPACDFAPAAAG